MIRYSNFSNQNITYRNRIHYNALCEGLSWNSKDLEFVTYKNPDKLYQAHYEEWIEKSWNWLKSIGLKENLMFKYKQTELAHYARACTDITFQFPFGVQELMGIAARGNFDLSAHGEGC